MIGFILEVPDPEAVAEVMKSIDPPSVPHFAGSAHVIVEPHLTTLLGWLDDRKELAPAASEAMLVYAFRYALGRQTYAVTEVIATIIGASLALSAHTRQTIAREIDAAIAADRAGAAVDVAAWRALSERLHRIDDGIPSTGAQS